MNNTSGWTCNEFRGPFALCTLVCNVRVLKFLLLEHSICVKHLGLGDTREVRDGGYMEDTEWALRRQ